MKNRSFFGMNTVKNPLIKNLLAFFALFFLCAGMRAQAIELPGTFSDDSEFKEDLEYELTDNASFETLKIINSETNPGAKSIDLKGHNLTVDTLVLGDNYNVGGDLVIKDTAGGGKVTVRYLDATTWNCDKSLEIQLPVEFTVTGLVNTGNAGTGNYDGSNGVVFKGDGKIVLSGQIVGGDRVSLDDSANLDISGNSAIWTGKISSDWNDDGNWISKPKNDGTSDVFIPVITGTNHAPEITGTVSLKSLSAEGGFILSGNLEAANVYINSSSTLAGPITAEEIYITNRDADADKKITVTVSSDQTADNLFVGGNVDLVLTREVSGIKNLNIAVPDQNLAESFTVNISGSGSLNNLEKVDLTRASGETGKIGTLILNVPVTVNDEFDTHSGTSLVVNKNLSVNNFYHLALYSYPKTTTEINAVLSVTGTVHLNTYGNESGNEMTVSSTGKVTAKNFIVTDSFLNKQNNSDDEGKSLYPLINNGSVEIGESGKISLPSYSGTGTVILNDGAVFENNCTSENQTTIAGVKLKLQDKADYTVAAAVDAGYGNITVTGITVETATVGTRSITLAGTEAGSTVSISGVSNNLNNITLSSGTALIGADVSILGDFEIGSSVTVSGAGKISCGGKLTNNGTFNGSGTVTAGGNFTDVGTWNGTGDITLNGSADQTFTPKAGKTYSKVIIDNAAGKSVSLGASLQCANLEIKENGTLSAGANNITITGDFSNFGTFTAGTGTVVLSGKGPHKVSGTTTFNNLECTTEDAVIKFEEGNTQTVSGVMTVTGTVGHDITLGLLETDASTAGTWGLYYAPSKITKDNFNYVKIEKSASANNIPSVVRLDKGDYKVTDGGNNKNWFAEKKVYWFGSDGGGDEANKTLWSYVGNWKASSDGNTDVLIAPSTSDDALEVYISNTSISVPVLTSAVNILKVEVSESAEIDLNGNALTAETLSNSGTVTLNGGTLSVNDSYTNSGNVVSKGTETVSLPDSRTTGKILTESGTWEYTGGKVPVFPSADTGKKYNKIVINGTVSLGISGADPAETISAVSAEINSGKSLTLANNSLSLTGALTNNGTLNIDGSGSVTTGSVTNSGTIDISSSGTIDKLNSDSGLVKYSGSAAQRILPFTYYNLELENTSAAGLSVTENVTVSNALIVSENSIVSVASGKAFTVSGTTDTSAGTETLTLSGAGSAIYTGAVGPTKTFTTITSSIYSLTFGNTVSIGTLEIDGETILVPGSAANFTNITVNNGDKLTSAGNIKVSGTFKDLNTSESGLSSTGTVTFTGASSSISTASGNTKFNDIFVKKGKKLTTTSSFEVGGMFELEAADDSSVPDPVLTPGVFKSTAGTIVFSGSSKSISGQCEFNNVTFAEDSSVSLSAGNTFNDLTFEKGSTVIFAADTEQTVNGKIISNGTGGEGGKLVTLQSTSGQWSINFNQEAAGNNLEYLSVTNSKFTGTNGPAEALHSTDGGNNESWIFPGQAYTWTAGASEDDDKTNWNVKENWSPATVPGKGAVVTIPKGLAKYPALTADLDLCYSSSAKGYITTVADGTKPGSLDLGDHNLIAGEVTNGGVLRLEGSHLKLDILTNNGLLKLYGNEQFGTHGLSSEFGVSSVVSGANSTVEYYGPSTSVSASASGWLEKSDGYKNLVIDSGTEFTVSSYTRVSDTGVSTTTSKTTTGSLTNNGTVIVPSGLTLEFASYTGAKDSTNPSVLVDEIELTNGTINHTGSTDAVIGNLELTTKGILKGTTVSGKSLSAVSVTYDSEPALETTGNVKLPGGNIGVLTVSSGNLTINTAVTFSGAVENKGTLTLTESGTFASSVTNSGTINAGSGSLAFRGNYNSVVPDPSDLDADPLIGSLVGKSTVASGVIISFEGDATFGNFTHNGEKVAFIKSGDQTFSTNGQDFAALSFEGSGTKTVTGDIKATSLVVGDGTTGTTVTYATGKTVKVSVSGNTTLNASSSLSASGSGNFTGTFGNSGTLALGTTGTFGGVVTNSGTITLGTTATFSSAVTNTGTINLGTGNSIFSGNYAGVSGTNVGSLVGTSKTKTEADGSETDINPLITFNGNVTFGDSGFTHNGDSVKIASDNAQNVTTGGNSFAALTFEGSGTKTITGDISAASLVLGDETTGTTVKNATNKTVKVSVSGNTTLNGSSFLSVSGSGSFTGTFGNSGALTLGTTGIFGGAVANSGTITLGTTGDFSAAVTNTGTINLGTEDSTFSGNYTGVSGTNVGTLSGTSAKKTEDDGSKTDINPLITFKGNVTFGNFNHNGDSVLFTSVADQTLTTNNQNFADVEFSSAGENKTISVTGTLVVYGNLTNTKGLSENVSIKISGTENFATTSITGVKKVKDFTVENTSTAYTKTVLFPASGSNPPLAGSGLTVTGNFILSGKDRGINGKSVKLSAQGTPSEDITTWWYLESVDPSKVTVTNAEIGYAYSAIDVSGKTNVENPTCVETLDPTTSAYTTYHWFADHKYYWFGGTNDNAWATGGNWKVSTEESASTLARGPKSDDETISVYIKGGAVDASGKQLILGGDVTVKEFHIDSGFRTDLNKYKVTSDVFENNGILVIDGSVDVPLVKANTTSKIIHGESSTVEYNGWTDGTVVITTYEGLGLKTDTDSSYRNLLVKGSGVFVYTNGAALKTSGTFNTGTGVSTITTTGNQTFGGTVTLGDTTGTTFAAGADAQSKYYSITLNGNVTSSGNVAFENPVVLGANILIQADGKNVSFSKTVTGKGKTLTFGAENHLTGNITLTGNAGTATDLLGNVSLFTAADKTLTLKGSVYTSGLTLNGKGLTVTSNPSTETVSVTGPVTLNNEGTVIVSSPMEILGTLGNLTVSSKTTLSLPGNITVSKNVTNNGTIGSDSLDETLTIAGDLTDNGDMTAVEKIIFNGTPDSDAAAGTQKFNPNSDKKYQTVEINNGKNFSVTKELKVTELDFVKTLEAETLKVTADGISVTKATSVSFNGDLTAGQFCDTATAGNIYFNGSSTVIDVIGTDEKPDTLYTTGTVYFNNSVTVKDNLTHTAGVTNFGGTAKASFTAKDSTTNKNLTFGTVVLDNKTEITGNDVSFNNAVSSATGKTFDLTVTGNDVTFGSTVDGTGSFTVTGDGSVTFKNNLGKTTKLGAVSVTGDTITFDIGCTEVSSTGADQTFTGPVTLKENCAFNGKAVTFNNTIDGTKNLTVNGSGAVTFKDSLGNTTKLGTVSVKGTSITFDSGCEKVNSEGADQTFTGPVTLNENCTFTGKNVSYKNTVSGAKDFTVDGSGTVTFENTINGVTLLDVSGTKAVFKNNLGDTAKLGPVSVTAATISLEGCSLVNSIGSEETWNGAVLLGTACTFKGSDIAFESTIDGTYNFTVISTGTAAFHGNVGGIASLSVIDLSAVSIVMDKDVTKVTSTGKAQTYNGPVTLNEDTENDSVLVLTGSSVTFNGTVDGPRHVTVEGEVTLNGDAASETDPTVKTAGKKQIYKNKVLLSKNQTLEAGSVQFDGTVSGNFNLTVDAETLINGKSVTTTGKNQHYKQAVVLGDATVLTGNDITFDSTIDGTYSLTVLSGNVVLGGIVGGTNKLGTIYVSASGKITVDSGCTLIDSTGADQTWKGVLVLNEDCALNGKSITFDETIDGNQNLTINSSYDVLFKNKIGSEETLKDITVSSARKISFETGCTEINSTGFNQTWNGAVTLNEDVEFFAEKAVFASTVDSGSSQKKMKITGKGEFKDSVGKVNKLISFEITGNCDFVSDNEILLSAREGVLFGDAISCNKFKLDNGGLFRTEPDKALTVKGYFVQDGKGNNRISGSIITEGSAEVTFAKPVYVYGSPASPVVFGGESGKFELKDNLIIVLDDSTKTLQIASPLKSKNVVLYSGKLLVEKNLETTEDFVLLGEKYTDDDGRAGHEGEYKYDKTRLAEFKYKNLGKEPVPGLDSPVTVSGYKGELVVDAGVSLVAGKNFYANGLSMTGSSSANWYLDIDENAKAEICFAEAYNCDISNSTVRYKGTLNSERSVGITESCTFDGLVWDDSVNVDEYQFGTNINWDFADFRILEAWTVSDKVVYVKFSSPVRNRNKELSSNISSISYKNNGADESYHSIFTKYEITDQLGTDKFTALGETEEVEELYLCTASASEWSNSDIIRWNTDATGTSAGDAESTDSTGKHRNVIPSVFFARKVSADSNVRFTNKFGKVMKDSGTVWTGTVDKANPVLVEVRPGQETHTAYNSAAGKESQPSYDAHNFIEFAFSEAVDIDNSSASGNITIPAYDTDDKINLVQNVQVDSVLGRISGQKSDNGLKISGLVNIEKGLLVTGNIKDGKADNEVHALYRKASMPAQRIRLSIAGLVDGEVTDINGQEYNRWVGYIDESSAPSGSVRLQSFAESPYIKDLSGNGLKFVKTKGLLINETKEKDYGLWDCSKPAFAPYRRASSKWETPGSANTKQNYEAVGSTVDGTSSLKRLEFHLFDNTPSYYTTGEAQWVSKRGWVKPYDSSKNEINTVLYHSETYAADIFGGSRAFTNDSDSTTGGIRYSSIVDASKYFSFAIGTDSSVELTERFDESSPAYYGAGSPIFQPSTSPARSPVDVDGLYFGFKFRENILSLKTMFTVEYDGENGFITDLAGNRLKSDKIRTMDLTPPSITMTLAPVGQKKLFVMFSKVLETKLPVSLSGSDSKTESITKDPLSEAYPDAFVLAKIEAGSGLGEKAEIQIDKKVPAKVLFNTGEYMGLEFALDKEVTFENISNLYLVARSLGNGYKDPVIDLATNYATLVQDDTGLGNYLPAYSAHAMSDFAVNLINPLYAYNDDENYRDGETSFQNGTYGEDSHAVHDWDAEQKNFGTLYPEGNVIVVAAVNDEETVASGEFNARMYLDNSPDSASVSKEYNKTANANLRVWLPELKGYEVFSSISEDGNKDYESNDSRFIEEGDLSSNIDFQIDSEIIGGYGAGSQISFLFGLTDSSNNPLTVVHSPEFDYSTEIYKAMDRNPFFALRLKNPSDLLSLDLWSFRLKKITKQKGNVTILNNVIDASKGERTVVRIDNPKSGKVDVIVMTLDGNIVDYLNRGNLGTGTTNFTWNGTNRSGKPVARGMYFIRIIGNGFDETRKVMVVK
ncbi:MAG: hypothetical protein MJ181_00985 [Treponema sp.]|nr:hypothetical protein [Treponema sp.]